MADYHQIIHECSQMLVGQTGDENAGRFLNAPLLNVFLGSEAEAFMEDVKNIYDGCWINGKENIQYLTTDQFNTDSVEEAFVRMKSIPRNFKTTSEIVQAVYWDIMDDRFDEIFTRVRVPYCPPNTVSEYSVLYFVFIRQAIRRQREISRQRLEKLIAWAQEENKHLIVLSDDTDLVLLNDETIVENYRIAADIVLIVDSYTSINEKALGQQILHELREFPVYGVGYYSVHKDTRAIATVSLRQMLQEYTEMSKRREDNVMTVQKKLCSGGSYQQLFDSCFDRFLRPLLPKDIAFLRYLPYTEPVTRLREVRTEQPQKGFLSGLFGMGRKNAVEKQSTSSDELAEQIIRSSPVYAACISMYYEKPVREWLEQNNGMECLQRFFREQLSCSLTYMEMSTYLADEAAALEAAAAQPWKATPLAHTYALDELVNSYAVRALRQNVYGLMAMCLAEEMKKINRLAAGFDDVIRSVIKNLSIETQDEGLESAYSRLMSRACADNRALLMKTIHPGTEMDLLQQMCHAFSEMITQYPEYGYSLEQDLDFQLHYAAKSAATSVINNCFSQNMDKTRHLQMMQAPDGHLYCMVNGSASFLPQINPYIHGDVFMVQRSDCIERLFIYHVNPIAIIYN